MHDLIARLRALARAEHNDLSVADEAADEIERILIAARTGAGAVGLEIGDFWLEKDRPGKIRIACSESNLEVTIPEEHLADKIEGLYTDAEARTMEQIHREEASEDNYARALWSGF